jgi:hypothetical protein
VPVDDDHLVEALGQPSEHVWEVCSSFSAAMMTLIRSPS